jgi:hypothetical protein
MSSRASRPEMQILSVAGMAHPKKQEEIIGEIESNIFEICFGIR